MGGNMFKSQTTGELDCFTEMAVYGFSKTLRPSAQYKTM